MTTSNFTSLKIYLGLLILITIYSLPSKAQFLRSSYFMEDTHYKQQLNPSLLPKSNYINFPLLGAINTTISSTSFSYRDILDIINNSDNFYTNPDFMRRLKDKNNLNINVSTELLSAGWYRGKNFLSFNIGLRTDIGASVTKSMFSLLNEMNTDTEHWRKSNYNINNQQLNLNTYGEIGLGYARQINERLSIGGKMKIILGIGNMNLKVNNVMMNANLPDDSRINQLQDPNYLSGINTPEKINRLKNEIESYYAHLSVDARMESTSKGLNLVVDEERGYISKFDFNSKNLGISGYGLGLDLGASYKISDQLKVSASILDLGFIRWSKNATKVALANPKGIHIEGKKYTNDIDPNNIIGSIESIETNMGLLQNDANEYMDRVNGSKMFNYEMLQLQAGETGKTRKSVLASTFVLGAEYGFFQNKLGIGVLSTTRFIQPHSLTEVTLSANYRPKSWFNTTLSYSAIQSAGRSFGLAFKIGPVFLGTDYMFLGKNTNSINGFFGLSIPIGERKRNKENQNIQ